MLAGSRYPGFWGGLILINTEAHLNREDIVNAFKQKSDEKIAQIAYNALYNPTSHHIHEYEERLSLILEREVLYKDNKRLSRLIKDAKLRHSNAAIEYICYQSKRNIDKAKLKSLQGCQFVTHNHNVLITGSTGCGKTYIACADGSFPKLMMQMQKYDLIILDDFGLTPMSAQQRHDIFNIIEDRYQLKSTIITSQLPVAKWHEFIAKPTMADAILDRVLENAHRITMEGESMRKNKIATRVYFIC